MVLISSPSYFGKQPAKLYMWYFTWSGNNADLLDIITCLFQLCTAYQICQLQNMYRTEKALMPKLDGLIRRIFSIFHKMLSILLKFYGCWKIWEIVQSLPFILLFPFRNLIWATFLLCCHFVWDWDVPFCACLRIIGCYLF